MEVVLFNRLGKKSSGNRAKPLKDLSQVSTPATMLGQNKRQSLIDLIEKGMAHNKIDFESYCMSLIHNFISHCQSLPESTNSYYSNQGGVLDYALNRTEAALNLFREYMIIDDEPSEEQKLWLYALMSAGMMKGIGKLQIDYSVDLFDLNGQLIKHWNPLLESISSLAGHYSYKLVGHEDAVYRRRLNLLIARLLMPAKGFAKIAVNPEVLKVWMALLNEDWESAGTLGAILIRADAIAIQRYINQHMMNAGKRGLRSGKIGSFIDSTAQEASNPDEMTGVEFINWLMKSLESGALMINKSPLFMVPGGMLMSSDLFKLFVREHPEFKNWQAIQNGFLSLGLHGVGIDGAEQSRFEQPNTQQMISGVVFEKYAVALPEQVKVHNVHSGKVTESSAIDVIHKAQSGSIFAQKPVGIPASAISQLNAKGQWVQQSQSVESTASPGGKVRG
jgi:integrating conjugative element relaxase (TIGR03760 family)